MRRTQMRTLAALSILLCIYIVAVITFPFVQNGVFWVSFGFTVLAFVLMTPLSVFLGGRKRVRSRFLKLPLMCVGWLYLAVQTASGFACMAYAAAIPAWAAALLDAALLALAACGILLTQTVDAPSEKGR